MNNQTILKSTKSIEPNGYWPFKDEDAATNNELKRVDYVDNDKGFQVNKPLKMIVSKDKKQIVIRNFFLKDVGNALVCVTDDRNNLMPIYQFTSIEPFTEYELEVPIEAYSSISKTLTFDKISFRIVHFNSELEKLEKLKVSWRVGFKKNMSLSDIKKELISLYMIAQTVSSDEFDILIDHYTEFANKLNGFNLKKVEDKEHLYKCIGLYNNDPWGGVGKAIAARNASASGYRYINFVYASNQYKGGAFCAPYLFGTGNVQLKNIQLGMRASNIDQLSTAVPVTSRFCHEVGHTWGGNDDGVFNHSSLVDKDALVIPSLAYVLQEDFVYYDLQKKKSGTRAGYTKTEKWIYNHKDLFRKEIIDRIEKDRNARNNAAKDVQRNDLFWHPGLNLANKINKTKKYSDFDVTATEVMGNVDYMQTL